MSKTTQAATESVHALTPVAESELHQTEGGRRPDDDWGAVVVGVWGDGTILSAGRPVVFVGGTIPSTGQPVFFIGR